MRLIIIVFFFCLVYFLYNIGRKYFLFLICVSLLFFSFRKLSLSLFHVEGPGKPCTFLFIYVHFTPLYKGVMHDYKEASAKLLIQNRLKTFTH